MADFTLAQNESVPGTMVTRYVDMGDGTHAQVVAAVPFGGESGVAPAALATDEISNAQVVIDSAHREVHEDETFQASIYNNAVANNNAIALLFQTGARFNHFVFVVAAGGNLEIEFIENVNVTNAGGAVQVRRMKRSGTAISATTVTSNPTVAGGVRLAHALSAGGTGGNSAGGGARQDTEWNLARNTTYLIRVTNRAGNNQPASILAQWYEEESD